MRSFSCWRATRVRVRPLSPPLDAPRPPHPWVSPRLTASSSCTPGAGSLGVRACSAAPGAAALAEASSTGTPEFQARTSYSLNDLFYLPWSQFSRVPRGWFGTVKSQQPMTLSLIPCIYRL